MNESIRILSTGAGDRREWISFFDALTNKGFYHSLDYIKLLERANFGKAELLVYQRGNEFVYYPYFSNSLVQLDLYPCFDWLSKYSDITSSWYYGGPLMTVCDEGFAETFRTAFHEYCIESGIVSEFIRFDPYLSNHLNMDMDVVLNPEREVVYINLFDSEEEIFSRFKRKCRKNYRKALNNGVRVVYKDNKADLLKFAKLYQAEMHRKGASQGYFFEYDFFDSLINDFDNTFFISIYVGDHLAGGSIAVQSGKIVHDYLRTTLPEFWPFRINDFLIVENIKFFKSLGIEKYDLKGGRPGVFEFKRSFSNLTMQYYLGSRIHIREVYDLLVDRANASSDFFPIYRQKCKN